MLQVIIKNIGREAVIEPYFNVRIEPGETKELNRDIAQRFLVNRSDVIRVVDTLEIAAPAPVVAEEKTSEITEPE